MSKKLTLEQHEFHILRLIINERLGSLKETIEKNSEQLDEYERDIKNYTTYDIHCKLNQVNTK